MPAPHVGSAILDPVHRGAATLDPRHLGSAIADPVIAAAGVVWGADPQVYLLRDTFTGVAGTALNLHTPEDGGPWVLFPTSTAKHWLLDGAGRAYANAGTGNAGNLADCGTGDIVLTATAFTYNVNTGLYFRHNGLSGANQRAYQLARFGGGAISLWDVVGTSNTLRATGAALGSFALLDIVVTASGTSISVTVNGSAYLSYNAALYDTNGYVGFNDNANTTASLSAIEVINA